MLDDFAKSGALLDSKESPENSIIRERDERDDVEVAFKEQVRRLFSGSRRGKEVFRVYVDVLQEKHSYPSRVRLAREVRYVGIIGERKTRGDETFFQQFGNAPRIVSIEYANRPRYELKGVRYPMLPLEVRHDKEKDNLQMKIRLLENQLQCDRSYLQLFRLGAASLLVSLLSILFWWITGVGAPFHPVFAAVVLPVSVGLMAMAFLIKSARLEKKPNQST